MIAKAALCIGGFAAGISYALWSSEPPAEVGRVVAGASPASSALAVQPILSLDAQLGVIHRAARIQPQHEDAWRRYVAALQALDRMTRDYERRVASGEPADLAVEQASHSLALGAALGELAAVLSAEQMATVRRLTDELTRSGICRGVLGS